ncbi:MAG: SH3 domain-containing protein [Treponema sp.]|nr:SH3 domain-containing protein [Treponema sp.]
MVQKIGKVSLFALFVFTIILFSSCTRRMGYGVLFWSSEYPAVPSGTVLRVYIRSNINRVWVVGTPRELRVPESRINRFEVPLSHLELVGSRRRAAERAEIFAPYALMYAETLQDGLPIRESPDNTSRRVYRLREGEIIKILRPVSGQVVVGAAGDPLAGQWYRVLTADGTAGYCFSYRLRIFEHTGGSLAMLQQEQRLEIDDPDLDRVLARAWSPEIYGTMVNNRRIDLEQFSQRWHFDPGQDTGTARIRTGEFDLAFPFTHIIPIGTQSWRFEGTTLQMNLRSENTLAVQFSEPGGMLRTLVFVALPSNVDDIIHQETARREFLFRNMYEHGPVFTSNNFGTLTFQSDGRFTWTGNMLLVPQVISASALGSGSADMSLFLNNAMNQHYTGAFTLSFDGVGGARFPVSFMYMLDPHGLRIEHVPQTSMDGSIVARRASSPLVIYFFRAERPDARTAFDFSAPSSPLDAGETWDWDSPDTFDFFDPFDFADDGAQDDLF